MHGMAWIGWAIFSGLLTSGRHLFIKRACTHVPPDLLVFYTRTIGAVLYSAVLLHTRPVIHSPLRFSVILTVTVIVTAVATVHQMRLIQREPITETIPFFAMIPVLMVPWTLILLKEIPSGAAGLGILLACAGLYGRYLNPQDTLLQPLRRMLKSSSARGLLLRSLALALTTVCDRLAIEVSSALTYAGLWTILSALLMGAVLYRTVIRYGLSGIFKWTLLIQGLLWTGAFFSQMRAVQAALEISSGVTYVKMLTLSHVLFSVMIGGPFFREAHTRRRIVSAVLMMTGALLVLVFRR